MAVMNNSEGKIVAEGKERERERESGGLNEARKREREGNTIPREKQHVT